jgi:hypothetical protein
MASIDSYGLLKYGLVQRLQTALASVVPAVQVTTDYPDEGLLKSIGDDSTPDGPRVVVGLGASTVPPKGAQTPTAGSTRRVYDSAPDQNNIVTSTIERERRQTHVVLTIVAGGARGKSVLDALDAAVQDALADSGTTFGATGTVALPDRLPASPTDVPPATLGLTADRLTFVSDTPDERLALRHVYRRDLQYTVLHSLYTTATYPLIAAIVPTLHADVGLIVPIPTV